MPLELVLANLTNLAILSFILGAIAAFVKSDLRVPPQAFETISMYLLFAIGLKGGLAFGKVDVAQIMKPFLGTLFLGVVTPFVTFFLARTWGKLSHINAGALAAHYGSVSAVTFMAALNFAAQNNQEVVGFLTALLIVLEIPGILIGLFLARRSLAQDNGVDEGTNVSNAHILHEAITGKSVLLLLGGTLIGLYVDKASMPALQSVFITPFQGILAFFLLELGVVAASRLREAKGNIKFMLLFGTLVPLVFGVLGAAVAVACGLQGGSVGVLATMAASASYIAAPAAVRVALPQASPALYLTMAISITLPFNLVLGIPFYFTLAQYLPKF